MSDRALIAAGLSLLAGCVHAGLAPVHPGLLGVAFAFAAAGQTWCTIAYARGQVTGRPAALGIALNVAILFGWALSRTVGLPGLPVEPVGVLDVGTGLVEAGLCLLLTPRVWRHAETAGLVTGATLVCLLVSGMAVHVG
jgi:hypothetical protein